MDLGKRYEFHAHTFYSDGVLSPIELIRRAVVADHAVIAITDHVDFTNLEHVLKCQMKLKGNVSWDIEVLIGVELTHIPVDKIPKLAAQAKKLGAEIVILHGESPVEPVEEGTNRAGVSCPDIDILAHPGNTLSASDCEIAKENNVWLELTSRRGHKQGNPNVAKAALEAGAPLLVNTDAHEPEDLITQEQAYEVAVEAGLSEKEAVKVVRDNPVKFLDSIER